MAVPEVRRAVGTTVQGEDITLFQMMIACSLEKKAL
jgi:hypothetical protein